MTTAKAILLGMTWLLLLPLSAQEEEESAALSLDTYTDEFQENFFEALKNKGIENYDKAINFLLECKRLDPANPVVDHELAKTHLAEGKVAVAQDYALIALEAEPTNYWFLETLVDIAGRQGLALEAFRKQLPPATTSLEENLALVYFERAEYTHAASVLKSLTPSSFTENLLLKIEDSLALIQGNADSLPRNGNELDAYLETLSRLESEGNYSELLRQGEEAMENFPTQLYFYYVQGLALNKESRHVEAIAILESALDYLLDEQELNNSIYRELATAHSALGDTSTANMYLSKIKSGS